MILNRDQTDTPKLTESAIKLNKQNSAIFLVWLFHLTAITGISAGYFQFFVPKTYLNLTLMFALLCWVYPITSKKRIASTALFFLIGMGVEYLGVNYGWLFGEYAYGENLGYKTKGVPLLIGVNWAMLVLITGAMVNALRVSTFLKIVLGATLMVLLDVPMEKVTPIFDYWTFADNVAPLQNYIAWFCIAALMHAIFQWAKLQGNLKFSIHLYVCQLLFFSYFYVYYSF